MTRINQALQKIQRAGFHLSVDGPDLIIHPPGALSPEQKQFIRDHKPEIIAALLEAAPAGNDHPPANDDDQAGPRVTIEQLPGRLIDAATRVCLEVHHDDDEALQEMLADLTWNDPADWDKLIDHFETQLPPPGRPIPPLVTCSGCSHTAPSPHHPAIVHCRVGVESGAAAGGWLDTDRHFCEKRE
jgi:rhodanese-related sulfurtransferase